MWDTLYCSLGISPQFHQNIQCRFTLVRLWEQHTYNLLNDLHHIDRSMWEGTNSRPFSMELCLCCSNPSMYSHWCSTNRMITFAQRVRSMRCTRSVIVIHFYQNNTIISWLGTPLIDSPGHRCSLPIICCADSTPDAHRDTHIFTCTYTLEYSEQGIVIYDTNQSGVRAYVKSAIYHTIYLNLISMHLV